MDGETSFILEYIKSIQDSFYSSQKITFNNNFEVFASDLMV